MNLNHGFIFDPESGLVYCTSDEHFCVQCQGWVDPGYQHLTETYASCYRRQGPRYATQLPTAQALVDGMELQGVVVVQASSIGAEIGLAADDGWAVVSTGHGQGKRERCQQCREAVCGTVVTGEIVMTWSRPMEEALEYARSGAHMLDFLGLPPSLTQW